MLQPARNRVFIPTCSGPQLIERLEVVLNLFKFLKVTHGYAEERLALVYHERQFVHGVVLEAHFVDAFEDFADLVGAEALLSPRALLCKPLQRCISRYFKC